MTVFFQFLWLLCGLGSASFAASVRNWRDACLLGVGFAATFVFLWAKPLPDTALVGGICAVAAGWRLLRPRIEPLLPPLAGVLAGLTVLSLRSQDVPNLLAFLGLVPALVSGALAWTRAGFAPISVREQALLLVIALGLVTAIAPEVAAGWQSATGLNLKDNETLRPMIPGWVLAMAALSAAAGGIFTVWRRS